MAAISGHPYLLGTTRSADGPPRRASDRGVVADTVGHLGGGRRYVSGAAGRHAGEAD